jgi:hypothetical protein
MLEKPVEARCHDDVVEVLQRRIKLLYERGKLIVDSYWGYVYQMEKKLPGWENKCRLQIRCIQKGNSIRADWCEVKWYGSSAKGGRKPVRRQIIKPKNTYGYTLSKLQTLSPDWAEDIVIKTETQLTEIRREASHLVKAIIYINHARTAANSSANACTTDKAT